MDPTAAASGPGDVAGREHTREQALARTVIWTAAVAAVGQALIGGANSLTVASDVLNPDEEGSLFQLLTAATTALAGVAAAAHALRFPARRGRFGALAAILLYFAADDVLIIHEWLGDQVGEGVFGFPDHIAVRMWIVVLAPLLAAAFVLVAAEALRAGPPLRTVLLGGLASLVAAVAVEVVGVVTRSPSFIERVSGKPETLRYLVEESFELGGWVLIAGGLWALLAHDARVAALGPADARRR
ncbi:MAG TPA: hypothetical protein VFP78_17735 [Solirubrobacteraceae bacterium]|nr:hypothetical protein [Solirubrobacteraceae bacterium]